MADPAMISTHRCRNYRAHGATSDPQKGAFHQGRVPAALAALAAEKSRQQRYERRRMPLAGVTYPPEHRTGPFYEVLTDIEDRSVALRSHHKISRKVD
jgi:hypothetical protein